MPESCLQKASAEREVGPGQARRAAACCMRDRPGSLLAPTGRPWEQSRWLLTGEALTGAHTEARVFAPDAGFLPRARRRLSWPSRCLTLSTVRSGRPRLVPGGSESWVMFPSLTFCRPPAPNQCGLSGPSCSRCRPQCCGFQTGLGVTEGLGDRVDAPGQPGPVALSTLKWLGCSQYTPEVF